VGKREREMVKKFEQEFKLASYKAVPGIHDVILVLDHLKPDFNIGKIFRSAEAFGAREICLVGIPFFDPYPAKGATKRVPSKFFDSMKECLDYLREKDYTLVLLDQKGEKNLYETELPHKSAFLAGHEGFGFAYRDENKECSQTAIDEAITKMPHLVTRIDMVGMVESLNVSIAASISLYEYVRQHGKRSTINSSL